MAICVVRNPQLLSTKVQLSKFHNGSGNQPTNSASIHGNFVAGNLGCIELTFTLQTFRAGVGGGMMCGLELYNILTRRIYQNISFHIRFVHQLFFTWYI